MEVRLKFAAGAFTPGPAPADPPNDPVQLGAAARALLDDPVFRLAIERIEHRLVVSWKHTADDERNLRELNFFLHRAVQELRAELQRMARLVRT
jgi:hypothetical protein